MSNIDFIIAEMKETKIDVIDLAIQYTLNWGGNVWDNAKKILVKIDYHKAVKKTVLKREQNRL